MAALTHAESRRLYSWWWDSHISPKNSKWLQENLTDMDVKVKTMIKLIEEDADSFARRAEMYYKKRPELMKLVEEFYRAYRALAERYDHATGALRQAHRTMAEAFPNQIPFSLPDDTPPSSSAADSEPHTPEMPRPIRALFEPDDLQMEDLGHSSELQTVKKNGAFSDENDCMTSKKGLKQLNEMFGCNEKRLPELGEGRVRKGLNFQVEEGKGSDFKVRNGTSGSQKHKSEVQEKGVQYEALDLEERENGDNESRRLQEDEVSRLSTENQNLKLQVLSESEKFKKEASDLKEALAKLKDEKEAALLQSQQCLDRYRGALGRISELETEIALAQEDVKGLNDEILKGITKSRSFEERSLLSERENQNLRLEMDNLVRKLMTQQEEIKQKHFELEKLGICVQEEHLNSMRIEAALHNLQQLHSQSQEEQRALSLELQNGVTILKNTENRNRDLENEIQRIKEENNSLNEQNVSSAISIRNLQDELHSWMDKNGKLEEEVGLRVDQRNALQQELYCLKEELNDLQRRYRGLTEQIESVGLDPVSIRSSIKELQDENSNLKETCRINGEEKSVFLEKLGNMDKLSEKNKFLENSLSDMSVEIDDLRSKLKHFEESYQTLHEDKTVLVTEKSLLLSQVDGITESLQNLEKTHSELQDQHSCLRKEKDSTVNQVEELKVLLEVQKQEQENLTRSCDALCNQIDFLQEEGRLLKQKLEEEEDECMNVQLESYMLQLCVRDMKQIYDLLLIECEEYVEKSSIADKLVLELGQKNQERETEFKSLLDEHSLSVHINQKLSAGIQELLKLDMVDDGCADLEDSKIIGKIKDMQIYITDARDEKQKLIFENLINATLLEQMRLGILDLIAEKEAIEMESARRKGELLILESEKRKLSEMNKQLEQELQEKESREEVLKTEMGFMREQISDHQESNLTLRNENCKLLEENLSVKKDLRYLQEEKFKLEEENNAVLTKASTFENLALIFEGSNAEKAMELRRVNADLDHFRAIKIDFENEKRETMEKTRTLEMELNTVRCLCENLNEEIGIGKNLLGHKEMELTEVNKNVESKHNEIAELRSDLEIVKQEFDEVRKIREVLEKQILVLSEEKINQEKKISFVHQEKARVKLELDKLSEEIEGFRLREEQLTSELGNWEEETATLFEDVQASSIREALFEEKVCDLIGACAKLEENAQMEREKFRDEIDGFRLREGHLTTELGNWKEETATLFKDVHASSIREALFEEKVCGLIKACAKLEENTQMEREKFRDEIEGFRFREEHLTTELGNWEVETATLFKYVQASSVREVILEEKVCDLIGASAKLEENTQMEREKFRDEIEGFRLREEHLTTELGNWEVETVTLFKDVQASSVREVILEEKVCDLIGASAKLEENTQMEREKFRGEIEGFRLREEHLTTELRNWEEETATLFGDVLTSSIREALLEEKISDLFGACLKLEDITQMEREKFHDEISSRNTEIDALNKNIAILEGENEAIKAESGAYLPIILSLRESLTLLEDRSLSLAKIHQNDAVDFPPINHQNDDNNAHESREEQSPEIRDVVLELQKLQTKVRAVENAMMELERLNQLVKDEHMDTEQENSNLDAAEKGVEDLKSQNNTVQEEGQINEDIVIEPEVEDGELSKDLEAAKTRGEICKGKTKDIELDPVSDTFSYEKSAGKDPKADDQMLELWETAERDCGHESMAERNIEYHQPEVVEEEKSTNPSSELQVEKELGIDNVVGPTKAPGTQHKKVIDRLSSNSRRLKKLQITVQELKTKCEKSKKTKKPMRDEYDNARGKLKQSEETIGKYADINSKLTKCAEDGSFKMNEDVEKMLAETENTQKEPYELVRKGSVNIGKLELEVQGIQFLLHKLEQEHEIKGGVNFQRKTRVRLRDYLYGEKDKMKTKATLCGCMRPSTKDD